MKSPISKSWRSNGVLTAPFCLLGLLLGLCIQVAIALRPEPPVSVPIERADYQTIIWKTRAPFSVGERVQVKAQHRFIGTMGRFRFVIYQGLDENFKRPVLDQVSPIFEASQPNQWSTWEFSARHPVLFIGLQWENTDGLVPVVLENAAWSNPLSFNNYVYTGARAGDVPGKAAPIKAELRYLSENGFGIQAIFGPLSPTAWLVIASLAVAGLLLFARQPVTNFQLIGFTAGVIFAYRSWAWFGLLAPWTWGGSYVSYLPWEVRFCLLAAGPLILAALVGRRLNAFVIRRFWVLASLLLGLVAIAWLFRCSRVYGDWVFGYTNYTHAPFSASLYSLIEYLSRPLPWFHQNENQLISVLVFAPFLYLLSRLVAVDGGLDLAPMVMLLSATSLQCFFGYVEVYSVPMLNWVAFALAAFGYLDRKWSLWVPTAVSFVAYLSHVSEAMLIFPLLYLWYIELRFRRPRLEWLSVQVIFLAIFAVTFTGVSYALLYLFKYGADLVAFRKDLPYFGFEILAGQHHHPGVMLPLFTSQLFTGEYTFPGPDYAIFSIDNLMKVIGFQFQYSMFFFLLPVLILVRDRLRPLEEPKIGFSFIALVTYSIYAGFAYVGWLPIIRDWDLFAIYSVIGGTLTYLLLRRENNHAAYWAIAGINLLQTLPWILMNHFHIEFPW